MPTGSALSSALRVKQSGVAVPADHRGPAILLDAARALGGVALFGSLVALVTWLLIRAGLITNLVEVLLHTGAESLSAVVCALAFVATWSVDRRSTLPAAAAGTLLLGAGLLDLWHAVSYVTVASSLVGSAEPESLLFSWASRAVLALGLFLYAWLPDRPVADRTRWYLLFAVLTVTAAVAGGATVLAQAFPWLVPPETGPEAFRLSVGTGVVALLVLAGARFIAPRDAHVRTSGMVLLAACGFFMVRELVSSYAISVYPAYPRLLAHGFEAAGCILLYQGLVVQRLRRPAEAATELRMALQTSEAQLLRAQAIAAFATYRLVPDVGAGGERLFGHDAAGLLGLSEGVRLAEADYRQHHVHPDDRAVLDDATRQRSDTGRSAVEYRIVRPDGGVRVMRDVAEIVDAAPGRREALGVLHDVTERRGIEDELRRLTAHVESTQEAERIRIAREIHDELGGVLTGIRMHVATAARDSEQSTGSTTARLQEVLHLIDSATESVRRVIRDLRPSILDDLGPIAAIEWYADERLRKAGVPVEVVLGPGVADTVLDGERASALFRVGQEAITNIARHADATRVTITVDRDEAGLSIEIEDDGRGLPDDLAARPRSFGLIGMHERVRYFGGQLLVERLPAGGTRVAVQMPLESTDG
ncbi:MAG: PAS domain-containing protein [Burkholderiales bacterium]|nr:PAS domain-containing protein [Burkholderiales bacterium]